MRGGTFIKLFKKNINNSFNYMKEIKNYIYTIIVIFIISTFFGIIFSPYLTFINEILKRVVQQTENLKGIELVIFIFENNLKVSFFGYFFGIVFGVLPLFNAISNGIVLGYVFAKVYIVSGISEFWRILPHGIFELPAVFISLGLGLKLGTEIIRSYLSFHIKNKKLFLLGKVFLFMGVFGFSLFVFFSFLFSLSRMNDINSLDILNSTSFVYILAIVFGLLLSSISFLFFFVNSLSIKQIRNKVWLNDGLKSLKTFIFVVLPLLMIAAIVEGILITISK